jgi:hypothetical protein
MMATKLQESSILCNQVLKDPYSNAGFKNFPTQNEAKADILLLKRLLSPHEIDAWDG